MHLPQSYQQAHNFHIIILGWISKAGNFNKLRYFLDISP